ncbi:MAG: SDR family oxidoreductase [Alphaproteobacteria bacterium]|nr:SDR family oxidoreductase [Alphaproteobacteria bacterium]
MTQTTFGPDGWTPDRMGDLTGKTYLITGASSGTGFEACKALLSRGAKVVMLNRSAPKSEATITALKEAVGEGADVRFIPLELGSLESVREAAAAVLDTVPQIDALLCNAAIAQVAERRLTVDGFESQKGVNYDGHFLLCALLFDRISASGGRIVVVGSTGYKMGLKRIKFEDLDFAENYSGWNAYSQSKLAQMMMGYEAQRRIQAAGSAVQVHVCHPGAARTSLINDKANWFMRFAWTLISPFAQSAEKGAWPALLCSTEHGLEPARLYGPTQRAETAGPVGVGSLDELALNAEEAAKLWAVSEERTGQTWTIT